MAYANPRRHLYSAVLRDDGNTVAGGIIHTNGDSFAKLLYLAPASEMENDALPGLIEHLTAQAGTWGVLHVLAETEELSPAFVPLRRAGFSVYAWQRIWDVTPLATAAALKEDGHRHNGDGTGAKANGSQHKWHRVESVNLPDVQNLYHQIVPQLLQGFEDLLGKKRNLAFVILFEIKEAVSADSQPGGPGAPAAPSPAYWRRTS